MSIPMHVCDYVCVGATDLAPAGKERTSLSSSGMVFPQGLLVGMGPGRTTVILTSSQSLGI